jgi:hypothetical protein
MATKQETFDTVVAHLRKQGCKARNDKAECCYRTGDGKMCAAGCLIPDAKYDPKMEKHGVPTNAQNASSANVLIAKALESEGHDLLLVRDLQGVHDNREVSDWECYFESTAEDHGLTYTPPEPVTA